MAAGDASRGVQAFQQCAACHSVEPGRHLTGPSLAHVWGRKAGTAEGFDRYSDALQRSGVVWDGDALDKWLTNPQAFVPGTSMSFPGLEKESTRADVIAYLEAVSEGKAPQRPAGGGMMGGMMGSSGPANLRQAGTDALVASLSHCHDTYIIKTAAGATHKVWEYNVRLKTDSSKHGPNPGKPVMTGSGMQGDRVSIVFASPSEVSEFIKESCR
jgi:cytochrome c